MPAASFARVHRRNLIAQGLVPVLVGGEVHDRLEVGDQLSLPGVREALAGGAEEVEVQVDGGHGFTARLDLSRRERATVLAGGVLNQLREGEERSE